MERAKSASATDQLSAASQLLADGYGCTAVAKALGVSRQTAHRWKQQFEIGGVAAVVAGRRPGPRAQLTSDQLDDVMQALKQPPEAAGCGAGRWSLKKVARFIESRFGVDYGTSNVSRLMLALGLSIKDLK